MGYAAFAKRVLPVAHSKGPEQPAPRSVHDLKPGGILKYLWLHGRNPDGYLYGIFTRYESNKTRVVGDYIYAERVHRGGYLHISQVQLHTGPLPEWAQRVLNCHGYQIVDGGRDRD